VGEDVIGHTKRLQRALGVTPNVDAREDALPIRLGAVDDAVAAEALDERPVKRAVVSRERSPRVERRERPARREHTSRDSQSRPVRGFERSRAPRDTATLDAPRAGAPRAGASRAHSREAVVSFFNDSKGFGFASDDKGDDLFIHFTNIVGDGFRSLSQGQVITFEEARGPKGREAKNVRVVTQNRRR
jgi:CspA family cold shock protein